MDLWLPRGTDPLDRGDYVRGVLVSRQNGKLAPYTFGYQCLVYDKDRAQRLERSQHINLQALGFRGRLLLYRPVGDAELADAASDDQHVLPSVHVDAILEDQEVAALANGQAVLRVARYPVLVTDRLPLAIGQRVDVLVTATTREGATARIQRVRGEQL